MNPPSGHRCAPVKPRGTGKPRGCGLGDPLVHIPVENVTTETTSVLSLDIMHSLRKFRVSVPPYGVSEISGRFPPVILHAFTFICRAIKPRAEPFVIAPKAGVKDRFGQDDGPKLDWGVHGLNEDCAQCPGQPSPTEASKNRTDHYVDTPPVE